MVARLVSGSGAELSLQELVELVASICAGEAPPAGSFQGVPDDFFYPPSFESHRSASQTGNSAVTIYSEEARRSLRLYLVTGDKRGIRAYDSNTNEKVAAVHQNGFRVVVVGDPGLSFSGEAQTRLMGFAPLSELDAALSWVRSNRLDEIALESLETPPATREDIEAFLERHALLSRVKHELFSAVDRVTAALDRMSEDLVRLYGRRPLSIGGSVYDASYTRERVYWKRRPERLITDETRRQVAEQELRDARRLREVLPPEDVAVVYDYPVPPGFSELTGSTLGAA